MLNNFKFWKALLMTVAIAGSGNAAAENIRVNMTTSQGDMVLELYPDKAPETVKNFLSYVDEGYFDGTIFHRVIKGFMIQGGGFSATMERKDARDPIKNEATNGLTNERGTLAMARTNDPHSATAQFFINVVNNDFLNHTSPSGQGWGYAVFGKVVEGMDVADKIENVPTTSKAPFGQDVPSENVVIVKMSRAK